MTNKINKQKKTHKIKFKKRLKYIKEMTIKVNDRELNILKHEYNNHIINTQM